MRDWPGRLIATPHGEVFVRHHPRPGDVEERGRVGGELLEPAVFVHGLGGESLDWADVADALADRLDGYALDLPGFGESPPRAASQRALDVHVAAVVDVIRAINRGPVHLVGNSLGGTVATRVAAEHPELVTTLALLSPALPDLRPRVWSWQLLIALIPGLGPRIVEAALRGDPERMARRVFWLCYGDPHAVTDQRRADVVAAARRRAELAHSGPVYRSSLRSLVAGYVQVGRRRLWRQARQTTAPTLLLYGEFDPVAEGGVQRQSYMRLKTSEKALVVLRGGDHAALLEDTTPSFVAAVAAFLERPAVRRGRNQPRR